MYLDICVRLLNVDNELKSTFKKIYSVIIYLCIIMYHTKASILIFVIKYQIT